MPSFLMAIKKDGIDSWTNLDLSVDEEGYEKSKDIFDVWFDSGITHYCVVDEIFGSNTQSDLYLEGSDQHRGLCADHSLLNKDLIVYLNQIFHLRHNNV